jgi:hypothetical protein
MIYKPGGVLTCAFLVLAFTGAAPAQTTSHILSAVRDDTGAFIPGR